MSSLFDGLRRYRFLLFILLIASFYLVGQWTDLFAGWNTQTVHTWLEQAGPWSVPLFVVVVTIGELVSIPGMIFVGASVLAYGQMLGFVIILGAAVLSSCVSFVIARRIGGTVLADPKSKLMKRLLIPINRRPVTTVSALRALFWMATTLSYALAVTKISFRDYVVGTTIGLIPPILAATFLFDWLLV